MLELREEEEERRAQRKAKAFETARRVLDMMGGVAKFALRPPGECPSEYVHSSSPENWCELPDAFLYTGASYSPTTASAAVSQLMEDAKCVRRWSSEYNALVNRVAAIISDDDCPYLVRGAAVATLYQRTGTLVPRARFVGDIWI